MLRKTNMPPTWRRSVTAIEEIESGEEEVTPMAGPAMSRTPRAPDGDALTKEAQEKSKLDNYNASVVKVDDLKVRLVQSKLDDPTFAKVAATVSSMGIDPVKLITDGDPDAMARAVEMGCDRKRIDALIEHVIAKLFNDEVHARNLEFERQEQLHHDHEWTYQWSRNNPIRAGETNWSSHSSASEQVFFKDLGKDPSAYEEFQKLDENCVI